VSKLLLWDWTKKKRTMMRNIKSGDVFCFEYSENSYCFGRIIAIIDKTFYISEIFDYVSDNPLITEKEINCSKRMFYPVNLDVYSLFDRKLYGDWRIIGHYNDFIPPDAERLFFRAGMPPVAKKMDIFGNLMPISPKEEKDLQSLSFMMDDHIKELVKEYFDNV
jgi:hypothetical protein